MISIGFLITAFIVALIPGTGVLYTISTGLLIGNRASIFVALGCTLGIIPSILACLMGLSVIIHTSALAFQLIKYAGAACLLYLAWSVLKSSDSLTLEDNQRQQDLASIALKRFMINILNPKLTIFFLAFYPSLFPLKYRTP